MRCAIEFDSKQAGHIHSAMKMCAYIVAIASLWACVNVSFAAPPFDRPQALDQLDSLLASLAVIRRSVLQHNEGRIFLFEKTVRSLRQTVSTEGLTAAANRQYVDLLTQVDCARDFFRFIVTDRNKSAIMEFLQTSHQISQSVGVMATRPNYIEARVLQMRRAVQDLLALNVLSEKLQGELQGLNRAFLDELSLAGQGDVRAATRTREFCKDIRKFYQPLDEALASKPAYELYLEIVGINELLTSYTTEVRKEGS